jgi:DNA-binding MarR family transcriptional regulator
MGNNEPVPGHTWPQNVAPAELSVSTGFLLAWTAAASEREYADALSSVGLTPVQAGVLEILHGGPQKQARLSEQLRVFQPVMVSVINALENESLVERRPHPTDRRAVEVHLLPAGRERLRLAQRVGREATDSYFSPISQAERATLHSILARLAGRAP